MIAFVTSGRRTGQLHLNRISASAAIYFVACCTERRARSLLQEPVADAILSAVKASDRAKDTRTFAFTVMPDHFHWVFRQGDRLSLGRIVAKLKASTRATLGIRKLGWQRNFYEHRLTPTEDPDEYNLYTFLNPYRASLLASDKGWPWWWSAESQELRFAQLLNPDGTPPSEWINRPVPASVRHGE
jgi:REP element-mobilizing transposase RayT